MVEHRAHAACIPVPVSGKPCSPSLYHLHLLVYLILMVRVPYKGAEFWIGGYKLLSGLDLIRIRIDYW